MAGLHLHDTLTGKKREFVPGDPERVTMYVCGPTVYSYAHIGNARPAVVFDVLFRLLKRIYGAHHVVYARNITDVEDKIIAAMKDTGESMEAITGKYADIYRADMGALGVSAPTIEPHATDHIGEMIAMMEKLVAGGHAYEAEGHVLFSVKSFSGYGKLSKRDMEDMIAGARVEVAPYKKDPADFVLWKPAADDEPGWDSPFGRGRPGWHIECSAMTEKHLGETIDIHGGGIDLTFPHHENEIAQSVCAHGGTQMARYWLHNGFLSMDSEKMSKSLGNVKLVHELVAHWPGEVLRYALLTGHYRAPLDWTDALLERSQKSLDRLYGVLRRIKAEPGEVPETVEAALADDLNTPKALAALFALAGEANRAGSEADREKAAGALLAGGQALGLLNVSPDAWFGIDSLSETERQEIDQLILDRTEARKAKDFAKADALRHQLWEAAVLLEDTPDGPVWRPDLSNQATLRRARNALESNGYRLIERPELTAPRQPDMWVEHGGDVFVVEVKSRIRDTGYLLSAVEQLSSTRGKDSELGAVFIFAGAEEGISSELLDEFSSNRIRIVELVGLRGLRWHN